MKLRILLLCIIMLPGLATAEIYKWKDKDGVVRYSDVPPPSNIKQESMYGKKIPNPTGLKPLAEVPGDASVEMNKQKVTTDKASTDTKKVDKPPLTKEEAVAKRAKDAEIDKKVAEEKLANQKIKDENCKGAKLNLDNFSIGGRMQKMGDDGERTYLSDAEINKGKAKAQKDVEEYCN